MAEEVPPANREDPGDDGEDVLGKLDQLLHKYRPQPSDTDPALPVLSDALHPQPQARQEDLIPTLTEIVGKPARGASFRDTARIPNAALETRLIYALAAALEAERARLASAGVGDPALIQALDEVIADIKRALPAIVRSALSG
jgi:hypothetical protein